MNKNKYIQGIDPYKSEDNGSSMGYVERRLGSVDLSKCKKGDKLLSSHGAVLEYIAPTPWKHYTYLDHVVRYIKDKNGNSMGKDKYGSRTNDGFVFRNNRQPEKDHDIVKIL